METFRDVRTFLRERRVGPAPTFGELHAWKALWLLGTKKSMGREVLSRELGIGPGAGRTLIRRLRSGNFIVVGPSGCTLSKKGLRVGRHLESLILSIMPLDAGKLAITKSNAAAHIRGMWAKVKLGVEQRDAAIRAGAVGATTILYMNGRFSIPQGSDDCERDFPDAVWRRLRSSLALQHGDVVIVASAESPPVANDGALAAALTLLEA